MIRYYKIAYPGEPRYFAVVEDLPGLMGYTEWRLDANRWVELSGCPIMGRIIRGDTSLDFISEAGVPVPLTLESITA